MNPLRDQASTLLRLSKRLFWLRLMSMASGCLLAMSAKGSPTGDGQVPVLEFIQPTNGAVFSTLDEIPIVLRAVASNDVFLSGEVFANQWKKVGDVSYCCSL